MCQFTHTATLSDMARRKGSQRRHTKAVSKNRALQWRRIMFSLLRQRSQQTVVPNALICSAFSCVAYTEAVYQKNRYSVSPLLAACVLLRRMATPCRWRDLELQFGKHASQLSEIFWEGIEAFLAARLYLLDSNLSAQYISSKAVLFSAAVADKSGCLTNCLGFIDGTVLKIARPSDNGLQNVVYNSHQARSCAQLEECMLVDGTQFCIYGDSGYNWREYMEVPFQGAHLGEDARAFNTAMAMSRVTVEWMFKEIKLFWTLMDFKRKLR
eukprot:IDg4409t1